MEHFEIFIIGGGAAGMAAALSAEENGYKKILLADRNEKPGGVLLQCVHNGFGLGFFREDLTGMEYAERFAKKLKKSHVKMSLRTEVLKITENRRALLYGPLGARTITFDRCIFASGCRERSIYSVGVSGSRPAGVMTCGTAQKLLNTDHLDVGDDIIILGSGDVGQIVARQLVQSGKNVIAIVEKEGRLGGLKRNQEQCIKAFNIPVMLNSTIVKILGQKHINAVVIRHLDTGTEETVKCGTLLTAIGMIPEMDLAADILSENGRLPDWALAVGNCDYVHDIVDSVTMDAINIFTEEKRRLREWN